MNKQYLKALIVDDEERGVIALKRLLEGYCSDIEVCGTANSVSEAVSLIKELKPDVVFLDIEMPEQNGFQLLDNFDTIDFEIIFITAYHEYAIRAIRYSALDYLLKPVKISELQEAVERLRQKHGLNGKRYQHLKTQLADENGLQRFIISSMQGYQFVNISDVVYCKADDSYTHIFLKNGEKHTVSKTLKEYEELFDQHKFFRIHKSYLINLQLVNRVNKTNGVTALMSTGEELPVSFRRRDEFYEVIKGK